MHLRDYQDNALINMRDVFRNGKKKVLLVSPTGSGKTVIASAMIKQAIDKGKKCLFVAHRRELVMQCSNKLHEFDVPHSVLMAGKSGGWSRCTVASVQTFNARKDNEYFMKPDADLIILDEAHRSVSKSFRDLVAEYPDAYVVGLTATPCRSDGKGLASMYEELVECGSIRNLTDRGFLVPTRIVAPTMPDLDGLRVQAGDYEKRGLDKRMNQPKLVGDLVTHWLKYAEGRPTVVFCTSIAHSRYVAQIFRRNGIPAGHVDGEIPEIEREEVLNDLHTGKIKVLANCQVLTEGWDEPKVSCVILARPTKSYALYLQMVGRALRPFEGKVDTLVIDHSGCVYEHGFPEDTPNWILTDGKVFDPKKAEPKPIEKQPFTCIKCHHVYTPFKGAIECPSCGFAPTAQSKMILIKQGRLVELNKDAEEQAKVTAQQKLDFYAQLLHIKNQKGYKDGWCAWTFKEKFGHFPHTKRVAPNPLCIEAQNFLKHLQIKKAKGAANVGRRT